MFRFNRKPPGYILCLTAGAALVYAAFEGGWPFAARAVASVVGGLLLSRIFTEGS